MSRKNIKKEKITHKIQDLEAKIKQNLEKTNLVTHVRIKRGDLKDPNNLPYIEFSQDETKNSLGNCKLLRELFLEVVTMHEEIDGIGYFKPYPDVSEVQRARLVLNPVAEIDDETSLYNQILFDLCRATEGYLMRYDKAYKKK